ncbi:MAG: outer membrane beta-barrel protein [Candidatus Margulisiibacteriota bacterium]
MKKFALVLSLVCLTVAPVLAGTINLSGRAGMYNGSGADSASVMLGASADYAITPNLALRGMVETTTYKASGIDVTYMPVSVDLIYSQTIAGLIRPYVGAGVSYNTTTVGGASTQTSGGQGEAGIKFELNGFSAGVEYRVMMPDLNHTNITTSSYNAYATGSVSQSLSF